MLTTTDCGIVLQKCAVWIGHETRRKSDWAERPCSEWPRAQFYLTQTLQYLFPVLKTLVVQSGLFA